MKASRAKRANGVLRFLDRFVGSSLLFVLGALSKRRRPVGDIKSIGFVKGAGMGDLALATVVIEDVRKAFPNAKLLLFSGPPVTALASILDSVDMVVPIPTNSPVKAIRLIRERKVDVLIDLGQWTRYEALITVLGGARWTVGFRTPGHARHYAYDATAKHSHKLHELENFRELSKAIGIESTSQPRIALRQSIQRQQIPVPDDYAVFHLWATRPREWPTERWIGLARYFNEQGMTVALTGTRKFDQPAVIDFINQCRWPNAAIVDATETTMEGTIAWLEKATLVVSVNTGIVHVAAVIGRPTIDLHGPTTSKRWGAVGPRCIHIDSSCPGAGFLHLGFEFTPVNSKLPCMEAITVEEVLRAVAKCLPEMAPKTSS